MKTAKFLILAILGSSLLMGCNSASSLKKTIEENPDILFNAIEKNPDQFFKVVEQAGQAMRSRGQEDQFKQELTRVQQELKSPAEVSVDDSRAHGPKSAKVTIVEYSDYNCGHCGTAHKTMESLKEKYGNDVRFVFKNLPILAPSSETAAKYKEAIALQSADKAYEFHSMIFASQGDLRQGGEDFLKKLAKKVGADMSKLASDVKSSKVEKIIEADKAEAQKFEFNGTPGFMVNGAAVRGAYPEPFFVQVVDHILKK